MGLKEIAPGMRKKRVIIAALAVLALPALVQSAPEGVAAPIAVNTANSQAALTGKSAFAGRGGPGGRRFRSGGRRMDGEFDGGQGFAGARDIHGTRAAGRSTFDGGRRGDNWRYDAGYYGGGYGEYHSHNPYYYSSGQYSYGPEVNYGPGPGYGPRY
jgi:hypothetical protein